MKKLSDEISTRTPRHKLAETSHREPQELPDLNSEAERKKGGNRATDRREEGRPPSQPAGVTREQAGTLRSGTETWRALPTAAARVGKGSSGWAEAACKL